MEVNGDSGINPPFSVPSSPAKHGLTGSNRSSALMGKKQQLTIFYGGKVCFCEVTEEQAMAILQFTKKPFEAINGTEGAISSPKNKQQHPLAYHSHHGLCMKRSLHRFLQARKSRAMEASPYHRRP